MNKNEIIYVCSSCGEEYLKWQGRCDQCLQWNTLKEFQMTKSKFQRQRMPSSEPIELAKITTKDFKRISTKIGEFDRVLGGGIVPGSLILLGGDPGIGKSTLSLQLAAKLENVLYISGEESSQQIKLRFDRLGLKAKNLSFFSEIDLSLIIETIEKGQPSIVVIDSIQTIYSNDFPLNTPATAIATAKSTAGSFILTPPTILIKTS